MSYRNQDIEPKLVALEERVTKLESGAQQTRIVSWLREVISGWWPAILFVFVITVAGGAGWACWSADDAEQHRRCRELCHLRDGRALWVTHSCASQENGRCACEVPRTLDGGVGPVFLDVHTGMRIGEAE